MHGLNAEGVKFKSARCMGGCIGFVDGEQQRFAAAAQRSRNLAVLRQQARCAIHHKQNGVGGLHGLLRLLLHGGGKGRICSGVQPGGIHQQHAARAHFNFLGNAVAGGAGGMVHQRAAKTGVAVEQRGLAHIGAANNGDDGRLHGHAPANAATLRSTEASSRGSNHCTAGMPRSQVRCRRTSRQVSRFIAGSTFARVSAPSTTGCIWR